MNNESNEVEVALYEDDDSMVGRMLKLITITDTENSGRQNKST